MCRADEGSDSEQEEEHDDGGGETVLGISAENALHNYNWAGTSVAEVPPLIDPANYAHLLLPGVREKLNELVEDTPELPYQPSEVQLLGASILGSGHDMFLVFPTGEGKMTVGLLAAMLLRRIKQQPKGVTILTQPLTRKYQWQCPIFRHCGLIFTHVYFRPHDGTGEGQVV